MKKTVPKRNARKKTSKIRIRRGGVLSGLLYITGILIILVLLGSALVGGSRVKLKDLSPTSTDPYSCCDSGDGADCYPLTEHELTYNNDIYALLKSNIYQAEPAHIQPTDSFTPDGHRIFINISNYNAHYPKIKGCEPGKDLLAVDSKYTGNKKDCFGIPDDELVYVCKDSQENCNNTVNIGREPFDVYFRVRDGAVPNVIASYCPKPKNPVSPIQQKIVSAPTPSGTGNLQLETFKVQNETTQNKWLSAWCKPADYFYPRTTTTIHFDVKPVGEFVYTQPKYREGGWNFLANPDGNIIYNEKNYPYIYWDAAIPNNKITEPTTGYSVAYNNLQTFLTTLLPKLGLNKKETKDFTDYWIKQLPKENYYFIGIIPQSQINKLAPLTIEPTPDTLLRVSLFFKPLDQNIDTQAPQIEPFVREGFTVIEWGGLFDTRKHPGFSCYM